MKFFEMLLRVSDKKNLKIIEDNFDHTAAEKNC